MPIQAEGQLQGFIDSVSIAIVVFDEKGTILQLNSAAKSFSAGSESLLGELFEDAILAKSQREIFRDAIRELHSGNPEDAVTKLTSFQENSSSVVEWAFRLYLSPSALVVEKSIVATGTVFQNEDHREELLKEIDSRKRAEFAVRESERRLREAQQVAKIGNWEFDLENSSWNWSEELYRLLEISSQHVKPTLHSFLKYVHSDERVAVADVFHHAFREHCPVDVEHRIVTANGEVRYIHTHGKPVWEHKSFPTRMFGVCQDITDRVKTVRALDRSERQLLTITDHLPALIAYVDSERQLRFANHRFREFFNKTGESISRRDLGEILGDRNWQKIRPHLLRSSDGKLVEFESDLIDTRDRISDFHFSCVPDISEENELRGQFILGVDITHRKRVEQSLEDTRERHHMELAQVSRNHIVGEMATQLAHEINQPLGSISLYSQSCRRMIDDPKVSQSELKDVLEKIANQSLRAGNIIRRIRAFVSKDRTSKVDRDIDSVIRSATEFVEYQLRHSKISLKLSLQEDLPSVVVDPVQIEQVIVNLLLNAIEALSESEIENPEITISSRLESQDFIVVAVSDNGPNIDDETFGKLFQSMFSMKEKGLGMGLSISRSLVNEHLGKIWAERNRPEGLVFRFTLPTVVHVPLEEA